MSTTQPIRDYQTLQQFKVYYLYTSPNPRNYALCIIGLNTALRITDILNLKWINIWDFKRNKFQNHLEIIEQKTGKKTKIALNYAAKDALLYLYRHSSLPIYSESYIFRSNRSNNQSLSRSQAFRIIKTAATGCGIYEHVSCHSLRKTFGYHAWKQGVPPVMLMDIYNHSSFQITKRYLGIIQDDRDEIFLKIKI